MCLLFIFLPTFSVFVVLQVLGTDMKPNEKRLSTDRCAYLMAVAIANTLDEVWISLHPVLLFLYVAQYFPSYFRM